MKVWIFLAVIFLACGVGFYVYMQSGPQVDYTQINTIKSRIDGHGEIVDYDNTVGVKSANDIGFAFEEGVLTIYFGNIPIKCDAVALQDAGFIKELKYIGITLKKDKQGRIRVFYKGEECEVWARSEKK